MAYRSSVWCGAIILGLFAMGCGGGDDDGGGGSTPGGGQVTDAWRSYCVATFTTDYAVKDAFGDSLFTAHAGEEYLMTDYGDFIGDDHAELAYLTSAGPDTFEINVASGSRAFPFTTDCAFDAAPRYYAVFKDVSVYATADLTTKLCDLPQGRVLPLDNASLAGYSTTTFSLTGPTTFELKLNAFATECGANTGFISVPMTESLGVNTWLVPVIVILGRQ